MSDPSKGRIAIKFGSPSTSTTARPGRSKPPPPPSTLGKRPRAWDGGNDADSDSDGDRTHGRHEAITGFGAGGAETKRRSRADDKKKEYVIARQPNRDWRAEMKAQRRGKNLLPEEARRARNGEAVETAPADQDSGIKWGLTVKEKREEIKDEPEVKKEEEDKEDIKPGDVKVKAEEDAEEEDEKKKPTLRSADDEALDVLLGRNPTDKPTSVIQPTETDAYLRDVQTAGEASTLADYEAMPVEEFGAALLRGMGWDGKERGTMRHTQVKRRPNRLGLGAKELKEAEDLGGWNQGGGKKRSRPRLDEYRREETKRKEARGREDSYKRERERERERDRDRPRDRDRDYDRHRDRHRDHDRERRC